MRKLGFCIVIDILHNSFPCLCPVRPGHRYGQGQRNELKFNGSKTEYLQFIRELPEEKVMDILIKETSKKSVFRQSLLEFLMLDPRLKFNAYINDNLSELAISMVAADEKLRDRLSPLIKNP